MRLGSSQLAVLFSNLGHFYVHLFTAFYAVIVLQLERVWDSSYEDLLRLWTLGALLTGVMALPAGRLGDVWNARILMSIYFIGMGGASIVCGLVEGPTALMLGLAGIGFFGAIYHPVGIPWLIRNARRHTGRNLAVNGIFGTFGTAGAGLIAGTLITIFSWRAAFFVPGAVCLITGVIMLYCVLTGRMSTAPPVPEAQAPPKRGDTLRVFMVLLVAMFFGTIFYHVMQNGLPKMFSEELSDLVGSGAMGAGLLTSFVFLMGGIMQVIGGVLADRFDLKHVYLICWIAQMIFVSLTAAITGVGLVGLATLAIMANLASAPAENMMLARFAPEKHHGLAFGCKFVLAFVTAPLAILLIAFVREETGSMSWLFGGLGLAGVLVVFLVLALPSSPSREPASAVAE